MVTLANSLNLDLLILSQRKAIRFYIFFALGQVFLGIIIIAIAFISPSWLSPDSPLISDTFKGLFGIGGAFVSSLSALQLKEILTRTEKIYAFGMLKELINNLKDQPKAESENAHEQINELLWEILKKTALS